jgi:Mg-chelatase subunit ChlD
MPKASAPSAAPAPLAPLPPASVPEAPRAPVPPASQPAPAPRGEAPARPACKPRRAGDEPELVVIFDASGSMRSPIAGGTTRLDAAKRSAASLIRGLPPDVDVGLVEFSACGQVRRDRFYPSAQRGALIGEIDALAPKQGTPLADALRRAGTVASDSAESTIVVVSDGGDSCGGDPCAVARSIRGAKPNVTINVLDMSETPRDRQVLQCIAQAGGGRVLSPGDAADMTRKMREAAGSANCPP